MPIRNPFARQRPGLSIPDSSTSTSTSRPGSSNGDVAHPGFERVDTVGSKASSSAALSVRSSRSQDNGEYKMSVVNDSGVYLPPSPVEKEAHWPRRYLSSRTSSDIKAPVSGVPGQGEIEHFSISRESFDSYRRSFDISARSPIVQPDTSATRQSLDSRFPRLPYHRSSLAEQRRPVVPATAEESNFEDVGLNDENKQPQQQKKRSFFSKFGGDDESSSATANGGVNGTQQTTTQHAGGIASRLLGGGRKRGQSGQGAELGVMPLAEQRNKVGPQAQVVETGVSG